MEITIRHRGAFGNKAASVVELEISSLNANICETVSKLNGTIDKSLIDNLRDIANQLEHHNELINKN